MILYILLFLFGLGLVQKGGNYFVDASVAIAERFKIPRIVIGGTIVSLATTAPELVVSTTASYSGDSGIAIGNALGSAIANIGLIVSVAAIIAPISIDVADFRRRALWMLAPAVLVFIFSKDLEISYRGGIILFGISIAYLAMNTLHTVYEGKKSAAVEEEVAPANTTAFKRHVLMFLFGALLVIVGSKLLVNSAVAIAKILEIPEIVIGLTAVAVGTSLPELVTAITSARKKMADLAIGNILGANTLNLSFITGASAMINPLSMDLFTRYYAFLWVFIMIFGMMIIFWKKGEMTKKGGIIMLSLFVIYNLGLVFYSNQ